MRAELDFMERIEINRDRRRRAYEAAEKTTIPDSIKGDSKAEEIYRQGFVVGHLFATVSGLEGEG